MEKPASDTTGELMLATALTSSTTTISLASFTVFPDLPFELRRKIWDHAAEGHAPRIVEIVIIADDCKAKSRTSSPAVLSTCIESREAALKVFDEVYYGGLFTGAMINWERDILYFNTDIECGKKLLTHAKHPDWFRKCRHLALHRVTFYGACLAEYQSEMFKELKNLEELIAVLDLDQVGGHPPERTSPIQFALAEAGEERRKYERLGDHMAYFLFQNPQIPRGVVVQEVKGKGIEEAIDLSNTAVHDGSIYQQPATSRLGPITRGSTAELCASASIGAEVLDIEIARVQRFIADFAGARLLVDQGIAALERLTLARRFRRVSDQLARLPHQRARN